MTTVLQKLSLNAYRGVAGLVLENLTPVSLVVGANNSGKSSILEAAGLFLRPPDPTQWVNAVRHRDVDMSLVDGLWSLFPSGEVLDPEAGQQSEKLVLAGTVTDSPRTLEAQCHTAPVWRSDREEPELVNAGFESPRRARREVPDLSARVEVGVNGDPALTLKFPAPAAVAHQVAMYRVFTVTPATHYSTKALVEHLSRVVDEGKKQLAVELLQVFDEEVEDLDVISFLGREAVRVTHRKRGVVDLASFGDGMRRSAAIALALTRASQGVLLVDEIETGIHPRLLREVFTRVLVAAAAAHVQIIATTHSLEAMDALTEALLDCHRRDELTTYWVQRKQDRHEVRRYDFERLKRMREGGLDIR